MTEQNKTTTIPLPVQGKDMDSIMQSLESGVEELFTSNRYQEFLKTMAKFHNYSFNNTMLIAMQRPDATLVTSYKNWQSMGRQVMKGEKGITIIAPAPYKKMKEKEVLDENQRPIMGTDGKPKTEQVEVTVPHFKAVTVFDIAQTSGEPIQTLAPELLTAAVQDFDSFMQAIQKISPVPIRFDEIDGNANGYYHNADKEIVIKKGLSESQTLKTAIHETVHAKLHDREIMESLGVENSKLSSLEKRRFTDLRLPLDRHIETVNDLLDGIYEAMGIDELARRDLSSNLANVQGFNKALELRTWTGRANQQQVLWHLLAYCYIPGFARVVANWSLPADNRPQPLDAGMPGGRFWFLPHWNQDTNALELPVPQVIDWLLDLLDSSVDQTGQLIGPKHRDGKEARRTIVLTLNSWRTGTLPNTAKIAEYFPDDAPLVFHGVFEPDWQQSSADLVQGALAFIKRRGLDTCKLQHEIPMTQERLEKVVAGTASEDEGLKFAHLLGLRYKKPDMATIRIRLRVARMVQEIGRAHV